MAVAAAELAQEPRAPKLTPYIPMAIPGVSKEGFFVQKRFTLLVKARVKKQQITEILLAEGTKIRYKVTKQLIFCASDILSVLSYEMARAPFGVALSYRELADKMERYCEKFVMVACRLLIILGLLDPPRQLSGRDRSLTWKLPGRQALIDALVVSATESEAEDCSGPHDDETLPSSGSGMPNSVRATDDTTCSYLSQDATNNKDVSASVAAQSQPPAQPATPTRHGMPDDIPHAASTEHMYPVNTAYMLRPNGIYAVCNYDSNYDSKDSAKLDSNYENLPQNASLVWDIDAITWLISDLCPLDRPLKKHEPGVIKGQAALILAQTTTWGLSLEDAFKRVSRALKYAFQEEPWFKANRDKIPFCVGKYFTSIYAAMVKNQWFPPDEAEQAAEQFRQGARRNQLFRTAGRLLIDLSQQTEEDIEQMSLALEPVIQAEHQRVIDDPTYKPSDLPYLAVFAEFHCTPRPNEASGENAPPASATDGEALDFQQRQADLVRQFCWIGEQLGYPKMKVWNNQGSPYEWVESGKLAWQGFAADVCPQTILRLIVRHLCQLHGLRSEEAEMTQAASDPSLAAPASPPSPAPSFVGVREAEPVTENLDEPCGMTPQEAEQVIAQMQRDKPYHAITYRTSTNGGVVLAIRWSSNPQIESEWIEVYEPQQWPGVWEARMAQTWARFEALRQSLPPAPHRGAKQRAAALWQRRQ